MTQFGTRKAAQRQRGPSIEPADLTLISSPVDFLLAEHLRHRSAMAWLELLPSMAPSDERRIAAMRLLDFLEHDLVLHVQDEEQDLFPILRVRAEEADQIEAVIAVLSSEHESDLELSASVRADLAVLTVDPSIAPVPRFDSFRAFAEGQRRHLAWENAVVLPLARRRLQSGDLREIAGQMAARRGLPSPVPSAFRSVLSALANRERG
ncbi:MAG: hemerythrin domain-containing protein [Alphaproteobacteria bacterium]|nr:hemerythrin domain-containing protein [Alphaproteobacteria bacterium]